MNDDVLEDYVTLQLFEESNCFQTDGSCLNCSARLLYDVENALFVCPGFGV